MANLKLFSRKRKDRANTVNEAGGLAYTLSDKETLAQYVVTGCFNNTFYADARTQLDKIIELAEKVETSFLAQLAVYARRHTYMKDSPALLLAILSTRDSALFRAIFGQVVDNGKMLRNFVQIMRSGVVGRQSLGSAPKKMVAQWLRERNAKQLLNASVGNSPSLADVIKMVHPKPGDAEQEALFAYLIGSDYTQDALPNPVRAYVDYKSGNKDDLPDVDFRLLTSLDIAGKEWKTIARNANWQMTRMNLNTFERHGCFCDKELTKVIAERIRNPALVRKAKVFPYQLMTAYYAATKVPTVVRNALQDAMEIALENVPALPGKTYVLVDVSGSMQSPVTGYRQGATSTVKCVDVAALFAAALLKTGEDVEVIPFDTRVHATDLNPRDSVVTLARQLAAYGGGGTACGLPLAELNKRGALGDTVIYFSDNESWADRGYWGNATKVTQEWKCFKQRNPQAKLILTDLQPYASSQAQTDQSVLNIGGFSDQVFKVIESFVKSKGDRDHWTKIVTKAVEAA